MIRRLVTLFLCVLTLTAKADVPKIRVAVAANFKTVLQSLADQYTRQFVDKEKKPNSEPPEILVSSASSGVLYNQITQGAPFDLFLSADTRRPEMLEKEKRVVEGSRQPYAYGCLVLWTPSADQPLTINDLKDWKGRLAIANPATAPYGQAAQQVFEKLGLWDTFQPRLVRGSNIQQTWQFVESGAAPTGMVAWSQLVGRQGAKISFIPANLYQPIRQELVVLKQGGETTLAKQFAEFILSENSQKYIESHGYSHLKSSSRGKG